MQMHTTEATKFTDNKELKLAMDVILTLVADNLALLREIKLAISRGYKVPRSSKLDKHLGIG